MADSLFEAAKNSSEPLAARMRPRNLDEYIGQNHIVGKGRLLRRAIAADQLTSVIFYGPPGSGKTTLARVIANHTKSNFITLNAVLTGVQDIRNSIKEADEYHRLYSRRTILFVDEVHRWNKSQQDALLPWVENGTIILIGATTENPFFEVNKALVSRSRVFQLKPLTNEDLFNAAHQALLDKDRGYGNYKVTFEEGALEHLVETANGDARSLLNALELAVETTPERWAPKNQPPVPAYGTEIHISLETAEESIQKKVVLYDRDGDYHYDIISAFIKSLRGRDPDAAMYWLARMCAAGEDPHFIFRRLLISACEDTGLADPYAISVVESCAKAFDRVGLPEGRYFLAHAALYLSTAPKSNSSMAFFDALAAVEKEDAEVPNHLKDTSRDAEGFGHGSGYMYPHAYRDHWVAQQYLPDTLMGRVFYTPSTQGYENNIRDDVLKRRELQIAQILGKEKEERAASEFGVNPISEWWISEHFNTKDNQENLTFSPEDRQKDAILSKADHYWRSRLDSNKAELFLKIRDTLIKESDLKRHFRSLVWNADNGLLLWEICRNTPEGLTCGICRTSNGKDILNQYSKTLDSLDRPLLVSKDSKAGIYDTLKSLYDSGNIFDRLFFIDPFTSKEEIAKFTDNILKAKTEQLFPEDSRIQICQKIPSGGQKLSALFRKQVFNDDIPEEFKTSLSLLEKTEESFFGDKNQVLFAWDAAYITQNFTSNKMEVSAHSESFMEKRRISQTDIQKWFNPQASLYGKTVFEALGKENTEKLVSMLENAGKEKLFFWKTELAFYSVKI